MERFILLAVILIAFTLRFIGFQSHPVGFNADEASLGYDAYSILKTGRDQWGNPFPLVLKSFGDYKPPLYSYLAVPSIKIFGLTEFATRLPNVVIGTLSVVAVYLLVREIVKYLKLEKNYNLRLGKWRLEIISSLMLAVSPWHIMMSRGAFESNLITFLVPFGIYFFLKERYVWSACFFGLSLFSYHSAKFITPLLVLGLLVLLRNKIKLEKMRSGTFLFLFFFSLLIYTFRIGGGSRVAERSISVGALEAGAEEKIRLIQSGANPVVARLLHNKYQVTLKRFFFNYKQYFSGKFLFTDGAGESTYGMVPGIGTLYIVEGMLLFGLIPLLTKKEYLKIIFPFVLWLLIAPIPAALATGVGYSGNRALGMIPVLQILETFGFLGWVYLFRSFNKQFATVGLLFLFALLSLEIFTVSRGYIKTPPDTVLKGMLYGNLEAARWLIQEGSQKNIVISRSLSEPQIFVAFSNRWDPKNFQEETKTWGFDDSGLSWVDQLPEYRLGNYTFRSLDWKVDRKLTGTLVVGRPEEFPVDAFPVKTFYYPDGAINIVVAEPGKEAYAKSF